MHFSVKYPLSLFRSIIPPNSLIQSSKYLHISVRYNFPVVAAEGNVSKETLMQLRKRTGYSISKCKQAILKFGDDLVQAEGWLQENARKEGWDKINKRANVAANQGLLGMIIADNFAAVVEVNCQTDFVARNEKFRSLVAHISRGVFNDAARNYRLENDEISSKWHLSYDRVAEKQLDFGSSLPNLLADNAGQIGEKITFGGACMMRVAPTISLAGYIHPRTQENIVDGIPMGHFATLVAFKADSAVDEAHRAQIGMQLCQHIIGMNPTSIGEPPDPKASEKRKLQNVDSSQRHSTESASNDENQEMDEDDRETALNAQQVTKLSNETTLLRQDFMLEPDITVYEFLRQNETSVVDFIRLERGLIGTVLANDAK